MSGTDWNWTYKDALPTKSKVPEFQVQGRKGLLGFILGRSSFSSHQLTQQKVAVITFFPNADNVLIQFATSLVGSFKTSVTMSRHQHEIHLMITSTSLEDFDAKTKQLPSSINIWCDLNGQIAEKFGVRPKVLNFNPREAIEGNQERKYDKQTLTSTFVTIKDIIVKSPAYQPKFQIVNINNIKSALEAIETAEYDVEKATIKESYGSDMTERELQTRQPRAWDKYLQEYNRMMDDMGLVEKKKVAPPTSEDKPVKELNKPKSIQQDKKKTNSANKDGKVLPKKKSATIKKRPATPTISPKRVNENGELRSRL